VVAHACTPLRRFVGQPLITPSSPTDPDAADYINNMLISQANGADMVAGQMFSRSGALRRLNRKNTTNAHVRRAMGKNSSGEDLLIRALNLNDKDASKPSKAATLWPIEA
jgi:hypothetical protein